MSRHGNPTDDPPSITASTTSDAIRTFSTNVRQRFAEIQTAQAAVDDAEARLDTARAMLVTEQERSHQVRRLFLERTIQSHSMELEINKVQDKLRVRAAQTAKLQQLEAEIMDQITKQESEWETSYNLELARHQGNLDIYKNYLLSVIRAKTERENRRSSKRKAAVLRAAQVKAERKSIVQKQKEVQASIAKLTESEDEANQRVESLALQVRAALTKRSEMRAAYRDAQQAQKVASEEADNLASEYRDMSRTVT